MKNVSGVVIAFMSFMVMSVSGVIAEDIGQSYYDLGVFSFEEGKYEQAEINLKKAIEFHADNPLYHHYLGRIYLKMKRYQEAEKHLKTAIDGNSNLPGLKFDFACLNDQIGKYSEAASIFIEIAAENPSDVMSAYYAGINLFRLERYEESASYFIRASEISPSMVSTCYYYAGICYHKTGKIDKSIELFEYVKSNSDSEELKANAEKWLELMKKGIKPFSLYLRLAYQYDDNIMLEPDDLDIYTNEDDEALEVFLSGRYNFFTRHNLTIVGGYSHYFKYHNELNEYDLTASIPNLYTKYQIDPITIGLSYIPSYYAVDDEKYLLRHRINPEITWHVNDRLLTRLSYIYDDNDFEYDERDGQSYDISMNILYSMPVKIGYLSGKIGYEKNSASSESYCYEELKAKLCISLNLPFDMALELKGEYDDRDYDSSDDINDIQRNYKLYSGSVSLSRKFFYDWLNIGAEFNYTKKDSNITAYEYDRKMTSVYITVTY